MLSFPLPSPDAGAVSAGAAVLLVCFFVIFVVVGMNMLLHSVP